MNCYASLTVLFKTGKAIESKLSFTPDRYGIFGADAHTNIRGWENSDIWYIDRYSITNILNVVIKYM